MTQRLRLAQSTLLIIGAAALNACSTPAETTSTFAARPFGAPHTASPMPPAASASATGPSFPKSAPLPKRRVGGTATGIVGKGLVLRNAGGDFVEVHADGAFAFPASILTGGLYRVTVEAQPSEPTQNCTVTNSTGYIADADITDVAVTCTTSTFAVGGTVTGLAGSGLVLRNKQGDDLAVSADGHFTFATPVASGDTFEISIASQPSLPSQTCQVTGASGKVGGGSVSSVVVNCSTDTFTVGGTIHGLLGTAVLQNGGADDLVMNGDGTFAFSSPIASGQPYAVSVLSDPTSPPQTCTVTSSAGTMASAPVTDVHVECVTHTFAVGGTVTGLGSAGTLVLQDNNGDDLQVTADGPFVFTMPVASGQGYGVTVASQPDGLFCAVSGGAGTIPTSAVSSVSIACAPFANASFEDGFTGWTITRSPDTDASIGGAAIVASGTTLSFLDTVQDTIENAPLQLGYDSPALPATFTALSSTNGSNLGVLFNGNGPGAFTASQVITLPAGVTTMKWNLQYASGYFLDDQWQFVKVALVDPSTSVRLVTLWKAGDDAPQYEPMTAHTADIAAYAGMTVRLEIELQGQQDALFVALDAFRFE